MDSETRKFIQDEIRKNLNIILSGNSINNDTETEGIINLFPGMKEIESRPIMHPYGFISRANPNTLQVTARQGDHVGNRIILGYRDKFRPTDLLEGESAIYASDENNISRRIDIQQSKITIGSRTASENLILGKVWKTHYLAILDEIVKTLDEIVKHLDADIAHTHITIGIPSTTPNNVVAYNNVKTKINEIKTAINNLKANDIESDKILSDDNFTEKKRE